jgi:hypothetical protein
VGHIFINPFDPLINALGGTLGQLLTPAVYMAVLMFRTRDVFGAAVALWWRNRVSWILRRISMKLAF